MRRLLVVSYFHAPSWGIAATRWESMTRHLRALGHEVTIVASDAWGTLPDDEEAGIVRVGDLRRSGALLHSFGPGGESITTRPWSLDRPWRRVGVAVPDGNVVSWLPALVPAVRRLLARSRFDCLVTTSPPASSHLLGLLLGARRPPWIADFRDGWTFEPPRVPIRGAGLRRLDAVLERRAVSTAEVTVCTSPAVAADFERRLEVRAEFVPNGWDPLLVPSETPPQPASTRTLVHTGTFSALFGRNPEALLRALAGLRSEPGVPPLTLVHAGRLTQDDLRLVVRTGVGDGFQHVGRLERAAALALQRSADALVLLTSRNRGELPGKMFEYFGAGRPIVALAEGNDAARIVRETGTGIAVAPDDVDAIRAALRRVATGEIERDFSPRGLERYTYPAPAERMAELAELATARRGRISQARPRSRWTSDSNGSAELRNATDGAAGDGHSADDTLRDTLET